MLLTHLKWLPRGTKSLWWTCIVIFLVFAGLAQAETIDWNSRPATDLRAGATDTVTYGTSGETSATSAGTFTGTFTTPNDLAIQPTTTLNGNTGILVSRFNATTDNESAFQTTTLTFNEPIYNLSLLVGDIDGGPTTNLGFNDIVEFRGLSPSNAVVLPTSGTPNTPANVTWTAATGRATANNYNATANEGSITVVFAGPVKTVTIRHIAGANSTVTDPGQQMIFLETVTFTRGPRVVVQKTSTGGTGVFAFNVSNRLNAPSQTAVWTSAITATNVTTTVAGTPVTGSNNTLFATATATTITETGPAGWLVTSASCSDSNSGVTGNPATFGSLAGQIVTIPATNVRVGSVITCSLNNIQQPRLTLVKTVTNDNGGTATPTSVTLSATGPTTISGLSGTAGVTNAIVTAGTYTLSETALANYLAGAWACTAGTLTGASLVLANDQTATCTINNNDIGPVLTLVKTVTNDNGGSATTANFTLSAAGPVTISGISGSVTVTAATVSAGIYALSETNLVGYAAGSWSCTSGTLSGSNLTLALGQTATCTINNNDVAPILTLVKTVTDTSGGPSTVSSFTLTATGPTTITGITGAVSVTAAPVNAGSYTLSEAGPSGYTAESWGCTSGTLTGANLVLSVGQTATCTINNIKLPTVTIRKISNGGMGAFDFTGSNGIPTQTITTTTVGGTFSGSASLLTAHDTITTMTETMPATFWQIETTACTGMGTGGTATLAGNVLTLNALATAAGRNIICTFTNRRRPTVTVQKITTGAIGGAFSFANTNLSGAIADITTTATNTATPASPTRFIASATGTAVTITETSPLTFVAVGVTCSDANSTVSGNVNPVATSSSGALTIPAGAVQIGADINCVFTNAQATPQLVVTKTASVPTVSAVGAPVTYTIAVNNSGNTTLSNIAVTDPLGTILCPSSGAATVTTLAAGATENCSMSYSVPQAVFDSNGGGDGDLDNTATASATYNSAPLSANGSASVGLVISPGLIIDKIPNTLAPVNAGNTIGYKYRVTNSGNVTMNNVTINDAHVGFGTPPVPGNEVIFSDVAPTGNSTDAATNASWDVLAPGDVIEFTSNYVVVQADIDNLQ